MGFEAAEDHLLAGPTRAPSAHDGLTALGTPVSSPRRVTQGNPCSRCASRTLSDVIRRRPTPSLGSTMPRGSSGARIVARGPVVMLTAEDDEAEVHRRIAALDADGLRAKGKQRVYVVPMPSAGGVRAIIADTPHGAQPTPFWQDFRAKVERLKPALVILGPLSAFAAADVERDNRTAAMLMGMLGELAAATGATVMLTHHTAKNATPGGLRDARDTIRGASALVNNGRWALVMWEEASEDETYPGC